MFSFFTQAPQEHFIDSGHVFCPTRGRDVDLDVCAGCPSVETIDADARPPFVRCAPLAAGAWLLRRLV